MRPNLEDYPPGSWGAEARRVAQEWRDAIDRLPWWTKPLRWWLKRKADRFERRAFAHIAAARDRALREQGLIP